MKFSALIIFAAVLALALGKKDPKECEGLFLSEWVCCTTYTS